MTSLGRNDIGAALRLLRTRAGLTQEQLATRAGIDGPHVSRVEAGQHDLRWSTLNNLLAALDTDLCQLQKALDSGGEAPQSKD